MTDGTGSIGLASAKRFVKEGAYVLVTGRRETELTAAVIGRNVTSGSIRQEQDDAAPVTRKTPSASHQEFLAPYSKSNTQTLWNGTVIVRDPPLPIGLGKHSTTTPNQDPVALRDLLRYFREQLIFH